MEEVIYDQVLQDGLDFSRQRLNGWKRTCQTRCSINKKQKHGRQAV